MHPSSASFSGGKAARGSALQEELSGREGRGITLEKNQGTLLKPAVSNVQV